MNIGLLDSDCKFPNLALMKISTYHRLKGDSVSFALYWENYDIIYFSKIFTFSPDFDPRSYFCNNFVTGGSGSDNPLTVLPSNIEHLTPDYALYNINYAIGFLTRGCPRNCPFCIVSQKEGFESIESSDLSEFYTNQKKIVLLDPNILACKNHEKILLQLSNTNAIIDFTQGLDLRLFYPDLITLLKTLKIEYYHFAWDNILDETLIINNLNNILYEKLAPHPHNIVIYVLVNYNSTPFDDLYRVLILRKLGVTPYIMIYNKHLLPNNSFQYRLQSWVNLKWSFWKNTFAEFLSYKNYKDGFNLYSYSNFLLKYSDLWRLI